MYSSDSKKAAQQFVRESLDQILSGTYQIPSLEEMICILEGNYEFSFDEYKAKRNIRRLHLDWNDIQVEDEVDRQRRHYENELRVNLKVAALNTTEEIENLIKSLMVAITDWKIKNL